MQAILLKNKDLVVGEYPKPKPGPHEVLVEVAAAGVNRADLLQREGKYPPPRGASPILGLEVAGTIVEKGSKVSHLKIGDAVMGLLPGGGYAQYAIMNEGLAMPIPENLGFTEAAAIPEVFLTAWQALSWLGKVDKDNWALIHAGASGVGTAAIQLATALGAEVIVTASSAKHKACKRLGAHYCIDYKLGDWSGQVIELTRGHGVDVIVDFIGANYWKPNIESLAVDGRLVLLGLMGGHKIEGSLAPLLQKRISVFGSTLRARTTKYQAELTQDLAKFLLPKLTHTEIKPVLDEVYSWQEANKAHQRMAANANTGKIVLDFLPDN